MLNQVVAALNLWDRYKKWRVENRAAPIESIATRFVRLFEAHGVHRNQIPRFFGHDIHLKDLADDEALLSKLNDTLLDAACERFAVRREWLDGAESQAHPRHDFYKYPQAFQTFLDSLIGSNPDGQICGVLIAPVDRTLQDEALLILQEVIGSVGDRPIYRFHLCSNWAYTYWKSRAYLTACVAYAWKHGVYVHGVYSKGEQISRLAEGEVLLGWRGEGIWDFGSVQWHPEDMALEPEAFLKGVDREQNNYGIVSGLKLWLELDQHGFMSTGIAKRPRQLFENLLASYEVDAGR